MPELLNNVAELLHTQVASALAEVMETTAFLCATPVTEPAAAEIVPQDAVRVTMSFTGPVSGVVEMIIPDALGRMINENMLASEAIDSEQARRDALLELMNMTCGTLLHHASDHLGKTFNIGLPQIQQFEDTHWADFVSRPAVALLDVDGLKIAIHVSADGA